LGVYEAVVIRQQGTVEELQAKVLEFLRDALVKES